jgi:hypothetical protein
MRSAWLLILLGLLAACAKVGPPSGGAVDRTPPRITSHHPPADAIGLALDTRVEIVFSESMNRERTEEAIFVSPEVGARYRWRGPRLVVEFESGLQADRTYVVTVGTGALDLRRNALEESFTFAFATGERINQGRIEGWVFRDHQPAGTAHVWVYDLGHFKGRMGSDPPAYRTQSGRDGRYEFSRLSAAQYRLFAFVDKDRDQLYDKGELLALPAGDVQVEEGAQVRAGDLELFRRALLPGRLRRVQALHRTRLLLDFDEAVDPRAVEVGFEGLEVEGLYGVPQEKNKVYALTSPQEPGQPYPFAVLKVSGRAIEWKEPVRGSGRADCTPPVVSDQFPEDQDMAPGDTLRLVFSEAMQEGALVDFWVESDSTRALEGHWQWQGKTSLVFVPERPYEPGVYRLQGRGELLRDLAGLALKDPWVKFDFKVLAAQDLAGLRGRVPAGVKPIRVVAQHQGRERVYRTRAAPSGFYIMADLLPGSYAVFAFEDQNENGVQDHGSLAPFELAEPYYRHPEIVDLSAGGLAEGIDLAFE